MQTLLAALPQQVFFFPPREKYSLQMHTNLSIPFQALINFSN